MFFAEIAVRIVMLMVLLLLVVHIPGKRRQQNISPMQLVLMVALGTVSGDVMLHPDVVIGYAAMVLSGVIGMIAIPDAMGPMGSPAGRRAAECSDPLQVVVGVGRPPGLQTALAGACR